MNFTTNLSDEYASGVLSKFENESKFKHLIFVITVPGIFWNGLLLACFYRNRNAVWIRDTKNMICNITSDFIISFLNTLICITFYLPSQEWPLRLCYVRTYFYVIMQCVSLNHILALCLDRCSIAVNIYHLQKPGLNPYKRSMAIWIGTSIFGAIPYLVPHKEQTQKCLSNSAALSLGSRLVILFHTIMTTAPWLITNVLFLATTLLLWRKIRMVVPTEQVPSTDFTNERKELNTRAKNTEEDKNVSYISSPYGETTIGTENYFDFTSPTCLASQGSPRHNNFQARKCGTGQITDRLRCSTSTEMFEMDDACTEIPQFTHLAPLQLQERQSFSIRRLSETAHSCIDSDFSNCQETQLVPTTCPRTSHFHKLQSFQMSEVLNVSETCFAKCSKDKLLLNTDVKTTKNYSLQKTVKTCTMKADTNVPKANVKNSVMESNLGKKRHHRNMHVMVTIGLLLTVFNISMWPVVTGLIGLLLSPPFQLNTSCYIFMFMNQTLNPVIYAIRISRLRCAMKEFLTSCFTKCW